MEYSFNEMISRLKTIKKEKKLTNEQLSDLSGVPFGTLNKILGSETKETNISTVIKLATALDISAEELIFGETSLKKIDTEEQTLLDLYKKLSPKDRIRIIAKMEQMIEDSSENQETA